MRIQSLVIDGVGPFEGAELDFGPEPVNSDGSSKGELVLFEGPNGSGKTTLCEILAVVASWDIRIVDEQRPTFAFQKAPSRLVRQMATGSGAPSTSLGRRQRRAGKTVATLDHDQEQLPVPIPIAEEVIEEAAAGSRALHDKAERWAKARPIAFAYHGQMSTPVLTTPGPRELKARPLDNALSFEKQQDSEISLGQFLVNIEYERTKALAYSLTPGIDLETQEKRKAREVELASTLERFKTVFSEVLERKVDLVFEMDRQSPILKFDGEEIPLDLLGEGLRSTLGWLADLLTRLELVQWADAARSPLDQEFWLILDEVDRSLHPTMQAKVLPAIRRLFPRARIYASTHSPFVVASLSEGIVFPIRPDADHRVRGPVERVELTQGQSLEAVTAGIFDAPVGFIDQQTTAAFEAHRADVASLRRKEDVNWSAFLERRHRLLDLNDEVRAAIALTELPVRSLIAEQLAHTPPPSSASP